MNLGALISLAKTQGASDVHLEPELAPVLRVRGQLCATGDALPAALTQDWARELIGADEWPNFLRRRSADIARLIEGVRCRINVFHTARGVAFAIRLLPGNQPTLEDLNLHPDLKNFVKHRNGLVLVSGSTGSGKSTTLAGLIETINRTEARHIVTIENPIEFNFRPRHAFIRQREVGRDTPSFEQGLLDALREDPDVLMVGEMRDPETMRLTLSAAETGHLVLATVHSSTCSEALQRVVGAFAPEIQANVAAQLADCLLGVVAQRLHFRPSANMVVPECEVLTATYPIKTYIRNREFFKIISTIETGAEHGMWSFQRYRTWLDKRTQFHTVAATDSEAPPAMAIPPVPPPGASGPPGSPAATPARVIEIEPTEDFDKILKRRL